MSAIFSYKQWMEIVDRGTSGDQVYDILASWKADASALRSRVEELEAELGRMLQIGINQTGENTRLREMVRWHSPEETPEKFPIVVEDEYGFEIYQTIKPYGIKRWWYLPIPPEVNNE